MGEVPVDLTKATIMAPHTDNGSAGWTTPGRIPEAAVEAAKLAIWNAPLGRLTSEPERESFARAALEAAAPHMTNTHDNTQGEK